MNEESTSYKVTDRRLFNPDGTPRDVPENERPEPTPPKPEVVSAAASPPPEPPAVEAAAPIDVETISPVATGEEVGPAGVESEIGRAHV